LKPAYELSALERRIRQKVQGVQHNFWVVTHPGFEKTVAKEIAQILGTSTTDMQIGFGGIEFTGRLEDCWKVNALARTPSRVSLRLDQFHATQFPELIRKVAEIPWELYLSPHSDGNINVTSRQSKLIHTDAIEERVSAGIMMRLAPWRDVIPTPTRPALPQMVLVRFENDRCTISLDSSGELLFKRGFDKFTEEAPLRDTLAACILRHGRFDSCTQLIDGMSGSGTFGLEALLSRTLSKAPGHVRRFAFEEWPGFRPQAYAHMLKNLALPMETQPITSIICSDTDPKAVQTIRTNFDAIGAGQASVVRIAQNDFFNTKLPLGADPATTLVALNPPYGIRIAQNGPNLYQRIGLHLRTNYPKCLFAIICPTSEEAKDLALPVASQIITKHGGLEVGVVFGWVPGE